MTESGHNPLVFVCGHRKSGTTLFVNLLDAHPELSVYPADLTMLYAYFPEFIRTHEDAGTRRARLQRILFDDLDARLSRLATSPPLDVRALGEAFFSRAGDDELSQPGRLISHLIASYEKLTGSAGKRWGVLKETSIEIYAAEILAWFPDARFIHVLRDPRDNFAALAAGVDTHYSKLGEDRNRTLASLLHRVRLGFNMAGHNVKAFGKERYYLLRFEDLVSEPEMALKAVAAFLGIEFDSAMTAPTVLGLPTWGNNYEGEAKYTVDTRNVGRWRERITDDEAMTIEFHMRDEMVEFGYAPSFSPKQQVAAAAEFYKWQNYAYFYGDRFAEEAGK